MADATQRRSPATVSPRALKPARRPRSSCSGVRVGLLGALAVVVSGCVYDWPMVPCGNGRIDPGESCDGNDLGGETCTTQGFAAGHLACATDCTFDTSNCSSDAICGDGFVAPIEECDDENLTAGDGCDGDCAVEPGYMCTGEPSVCEAGCGNGLCYQAGGEDPISCPADCGWIQVTAGAAHTCGLKGDGTVWCWGANGRGQIGDDTTDAHNTPVRAGNLNRVVQVSAGDAHTCALTANGDIWCWGANDSGQLGDATISDRWTPTQVVDLLDASQISAGAAHTCAVTVDQAAYCWGKNDWGQLADGTQYDRQTPNPVSAGEGLTEVTMVAAGGGHTCALHGNLTLWCWGHNDKGQLGVGDNVDSLLPLQVDSSTGLAMARALTAGLEHTCVVDLQGMTWCWGENARHRLGDGTTQPKDSPSPSINLTNAERLDAGDRHSCAVDTTGGIWCWGDNTDLQLGVGSIVNQSDPIQLPDLSAGNWVSAGGLHGCACLRNGTLWCWGQNDSGQLGDASDTASATPVAVEDPY